MTDPGARLTAGGATFAVRAPRATGVDLCLFDGRYERRFPMARDGDLWRGEVSGVVAGQRYGYRAQGTWAPERGHWFDPAKLLVDPYATAVDRRFGWHPALNQYGVDTVALVPWGVIEQPLPDVPHAPPVFTPGGLIYEVNVRGFTMLHPDVPEAQRGTVAALAHPVIIAHLRKLRVSAVVLMPIVAWIDERHLPPLGLTNAWGYNPVAPMALDPRLVPAAWRSCAPPSRRCMRRASASYSIWCSTTQARATIMARSSRCAGSTMPPMRTSRTESSSTIPAPATPSISGMARYGR